MAGQRPIPMSAASLSAMGESQAGAGPSREDAPTPKPWLSCRRANWHAGPLPMRSEEHTSELQSLMRISYAVFCLKKKKKTSYRECVYHNKPQMTCAYTLSHTTS